MGPILQLRMCTHKKIPLKVKRQAGVGESSWNITNKRIHMLNIQIIVINQLGKDSHIQKWVKDLKRNFLQKRIFNWPIYEKVLNLISNQENAIWKHNKYTTYSLDSLVGKDVEQHEILELLVNHILYSYYGKLPVIIY